MAHKPFSVPEWVKNLTILVLTLSALCLIVLSPLSQWLPLSLLSATGSQEEAGGSNGDTTGTAAALPKAIAVGNDNGRYAVQHSGAQVEAVFTAVGALLSEALGSAKTPQPLEEGRWQAALGGTGVYFEFAGSIPLSALSSWLREGQSNPLLTQDVGRILVTPHWENPRQVYLYFQEAESGAFYACATALDTDLHLAPALADYPPNGAVFAFEEESLSALAPYTLVTTDTPSPAVYAAAQPFSPEDSAMCASLLSGCAFSSQSVAYTSNTGVVYKEGDDTLRLGSDGSIIYHAGEGSARYSLPGDEGLTAAAAIQVCRQLVNATAGSLCGEARLYLISASLQEDGTYTVLFGYMLENAPVYLYEEGWAARFTVGREGITDFTLRLRHYQATGETSLLLPAAQAAAALIAMDEAGSELLLTYRDTGGDTVSAGWVTG